VKKTSHADNHYLDAEVYALAAADILGVRTLHLSNVNEKENQPPKEPETPEESWIKNNESWLQKDR
jgi:phage terminase large subunit GpA-like protein